MNSQYLSKIITILLLISIASNSPINARHHKPEQTECTDCSASHGLFAAIGIVAGATIGALVTKYVVQASQEYREREQHLAERQREEHHREQCHKARAHLGELNLYYRYELTWNGSNSYNFFADRVFRLYGNAWNAHLSYSEQLVHDTAKLEKLLSYLPNHEQPEASDIVIKLREVHEAYLVLFGGQVTNERRVQKERERHHKEKQERERREREASELSIQLKQAQIEREKQEAKLLAKQRKMLGKPKYMVHQVDIIV
jgi:hypothetical protein